MAMMDFKKIRWLVLAGVLAAVIVAAAVVRNRSAVDSGAESARKIETIQPAEAQTEESPSEEAMSDADEEEVIELPFIAVEK